MKNLEYRGFVNFPPTIDMGNPDMVVNLIRDLVVRCVKCNPGYFGAIIYGSLARGDSHEETQISERSDVDLKHVVDSRLLSVSSSELIAENMRSIFASKYSVKVEDHEDTLDISLIGNLRGEWMFFQRCKYFTRKSIVIIPDHNIQELVERYGGYGWKHDIYRSKDRR